MFDSYHLATTKEPEQKRWRTVQQSPDIIVERKTPVPGNKAVFLSNRSNKQILINLLAEYLSEAGINVKHAGDEGDADVVIVQVVLQLAGESERVMVVADDTDILVILLYHQGRVSCKLYMQTRQHTVSINNAREVLGREMAMCLPFAHAISGCDTTSALFGIGTISFEGTAGVTKN